MMGDPSDMKQIFFTNLQLLGFDAAAQGMDNKIPFNKNMFDLPNKRGSEVVLHFLFEKLNPVMSREEFRHCWPIIDKQQEAQFRRTCNDWLNNISKNEPDSRLPRITGSLFLSPGGDKFIQLLLHFTRYVLQQEVEKIGGKDKDHIRYPEITQHTAQLGGVIGTSTQCVMARNRKMLLEESQIILALNREWKEYTNKLVMKYRKLSKLAREKDHDIREEIQKATERGAERGSPMVRKRRSTNAYEYDYDPQSIKRAQRVQEVRDLWKQFDDFCTREASEREVIESIVDKTMNKYKISASDINIKVPDLLLTECEDEIRRRHVDSNFHHGKLNLVSIIQLWNLCLHLYIEKIHQAGVPKFDEEVKAIKERVHTSHAYLSNTQALKEQISSILPELKESIDYLRVKIDKEVTISNTPHSLRTTSVGLGLMEPSPPVSFTPRKTTEVTPDGASMKLTPEDVSTPEAVTRISEDITGTVRKGPNSLFQGTPVYASSIKKDKNGRVTSKLPKKAKTENTTSRTVDVRNQLHSTPTRTVKQTNHYRDWDGKIQQPETLVSQFKDSSHSEHSFRSDQNKSNVTQSSGTLTPEMSPRSKSGLTTPKNQSFHSPVVTPRQVQRSPSDMIVDEVMGFGTVMSPSISGADAFKTKAEIPRSPIGMEVKRMFRDSFSNESSPKSDRSISARGQSLNLSNNSSKSQKLESDSLHKSLNVSVASQRSTFEPITIDEPILNRDMNNSGSFNESGVQRKKGSVAEELYLLDNLNSRGDNSIDNLNAKRDNSLSCERPKSPVGEILDQFETDLEDNLLPNKSDTNPNLYRPPSPVAEVLDSIESDKEDEIRDVSQNDNEEDEFFLEQPEDLLVSGEEEEGEDQYETLSRKLVEEHKTITKEVLSPLKDNMRRLIKEALSDVEDSPLKKGNNSMLGGADNGFGLDDIEMPDMLLDDSFGQTYSAASSKSSHLLTDKQHQNVIGPDLISFASPKPPKPQLTSFQQDAKRLEAAKHDLDEIFSKSLPIRIEHIHQSQTKKELNTTKSQLDQLEKSLGEIEGKLLDTNDFFDKDNKDDSDIIDNLDESFAPLKEGFLVEGGTPVKAIARTVSEPVDTQDSDIRTRMQKLKEAASKIKSKYSYEY